MRQPLVLVTGGSAFLGGQLCQLLQPLGYHVRLLDNDARDPRVLNQAMHGANFVIHTAETADVFGTWSVLQAAQRSGVSRVVYLSSVSVYGSQFHHLMHEDDPLMGCGPHAEARMEGEYLCHGARLAGLCVATLRLTSVVGPGVGGIFASLYRTAAAGRHFPMLTQGDDPCQVLDVEDLCQAVLRCLALPQELVNDTFNVGGQAYGTWRDSFQAVLDRAGHGKRVIAIPAAPAIAVLRWLESLGWPAGAAVRATAARDSYCSVRRIDSKLGFQPRHSGHDALVRHFERYLERVTGENVVPFPGLHAVP